jgi:hypothetical protein
MNFVESTLFPKNLRVPFGPIINKDYTFGVSSDTTNIQNFYFGQVQVISQDSLLFGHENIHESLFLDKVIPEAQPFDVFEEYLSIRLYSSNKQIVYNRTYSQFQDFMGALGGITAQLAIFIGILYGIYNTISLKLYILNRTLFHYKVQEEGLDITFCDAMKFILYWKVSCACCAGCFSARTKRLSAFYFTGEEVLLRNLDIRTYVKNSNDIRVLKEIMFNKKQEVLLARIINDELVEETDSLIAERTKKKENGQKVEQEEPTIKKSRTIV